MKPDNPAFYIGSTCLDLKKIATSSGLHFIGHLLDMTALEAIKEQMNDTSNVREVPAWDL